MPDMGVFNLLFFLLFLILLDDPLLITSVATEVKEENGDIGNIANSTRIPQPPPPMPPPSSAVARSRIATFKPGIAIIVGIITTIFSITLLLLLYAKHCKRSTYATNSRGNPLSRGNSGIKRKVIESLPMFRFSSLRGQKDGLECAVCLNKFEPDEVLRLLPKCKHAFHVECVDTWLDEHSTCPLCRYRVDPEDVLLVDYHDSNTKALYNHNQGDQLTPRNSDHGKEKEYVNPRISGRHSYAGERGSSLEIIVENSGQDSRGRVSLDSWSFRRKTGSENRRADFRSKSSNSWRSSRRKSGSQRGKDGPLTENPGRKDGQLPVQGDKHRLEHRIIISGGGEAEEEEAQRRRWSDVQAAEILYLRSEMILGGGGEDEEGSGRGVINDRSVSEITGMSRYRSNNGGGERRERQEEGVLKRWLDWIPQSQQQKKAVNSDTSSSSSIVV